MLNSAAKPADGKLEAYPTSIAESSMRPALLIAIVLAAVGCQPAHRIAAPAEKKPAKKSEPTPRQKALVLANWIAPTEAIDFDPPIRFVAREPGREKAWEALPAFWNRFPPPGAGAVTLHLGLDPLGAALAVVAGSEIDAIDVKVPRHLGPIPIDPANPPTLGRWALGKKIFFAPVLTADKRTLACADCHRPDRGFSDALPTVVAGGRRTISLVDVGVRSPLFWDGRVERLEETLVPGPPSTESPEKSHRWDGIANRLNSDEWYRVEFRRVMGIQRVSQDAVAKVLATYLRTILAGDSLVDRADAHDGVAPGRPHSAATFAALLDDREERRLNRFVGFDAQEKDALARRIAEGERIAFGSGRCFACHPAPGSLSRLTFHNTLVGDSGEGQHVAGTETGRFAVEPIGRKDFAMRGAYRAPPLRNLIARKPYFHDGSKLALRDVLDHYNLQVDVNHPLLDPILRELVESSNAQVGGARLVPWNEEQLASLVLYLAACEGEAVDPIVNRP